MAKKAGFLRHQILYVANSPVIAGTPVVGQTLSVGAPANFAGAVINTEYQWNRNGTPISGANGPTYVVQGADAGTSITLDVKGNAVRKSVTATSNAIGVPGAPSNTTLPVISGTAAVGQVLTTTNGTWTQSPTGYTYQWKRNGSSISGATSQTYIVTGGETGFSITVTVTATNAVGSGGATSVATSIVS